MLLSRFVLAVEQYVVICHATYQRAQANDARQQKALADQSHGLSLLLENQTVLIAEQRRHNELAQQHMARCDEAHRRIVAAAEHETVQ